MQQQFSPRRVTPKLVSPKRQGVSKTGENGSKSRQNRTGSQAAVGVTTVEAEAVAVAAVDPASAVAVVELVSLRARGPSGAVERQSRQSLLRKVTRPLLP